MKGQTSGFVGWRNRGKAARSLVTPKQKKKNRYLALVKHYSLIRDVE